MIDQTLRHFKLVTLEKLAHQFVAQTVIGFRRRALLQIFANLSSQSRDRIESSPRLLAHSSSTSGSSLTRTAVTFAVYSTFFPASPFDEKSAG